MSEAGFRVVAAPTPGVFTSFVTSVVAVSPWTSRLPLMAGHVTMRAIAEDVAKRHQISVVEMRGPCRHRYLAWPRQEAMWLMRQVKWSDGSNRYSLPQIGEFFGRDHSTVCHGIASFKKRQGLS